MKKELSKVARYAIIMGISVLLNAGLYVLANQLKLPVWLDTSGTILAAVALEPAAGVIVGFVNNFILSLVQNDISSIIYFAVSGLVAVIAGLCMRKDGRVTAKRILPTLLLIFAVSTAVSSAITLLAHSGVSTNYWETTFCDMAMSWGAPQFIGCIFGIAVTKAADVLATSAVVLIAYMIIPKSLKNELH